MLLAILLSFFGQQDRDQGEIFRLQGEVRRLATELDKTQAVLQAETRPFCSAEIRVQGGALRITDPDIPLRANLLSMVSTPGDCLPAEIRMTATYFAANETFVCSGTVTVLQFQHIQNTSVEFRPYEIETFLKWWDGATLKQQTLVCRDFQGNEVRTPSEYAISLRIFTSVFPRRGGLTTSEFQVNLPRPSRQ
jgi:hypothetical protein